MFPQRFCHSHSDCGFARARLAIDEDCSAIHLALSNDVQNNTCGFFSLSLAYDTLKIFLWVKTVIETKTVNM